MGKIASIYSRSINNCLPYPTLFIHGNLASSKWWDPSLEIFRSMKGIAHSSPAVLADMRGFGESPPSSSSDKLTIFDFADDLISILEKYNLKNVNIVGHSVGGLVSVAALAKYPAMFRRAVLLDPVGIHGVVFDESMYEAFKKMANDREYTGQVILGTIFKHDVEEPLKKAIVDDAFKAVKGIGSSILEILKSVDLSEQARKINQPVLVLHGEFDSILNKEDSKSLAKLLPHGEFKEIKGHGHCLNLEDPRKFAELVTKFLYDLDS